LSLPRWALADTPGRSLAEWGMNRLLKRGSSAPWDLCATRPTEELERSASMRTRDAHYEEVQAMTEVAGSTGSKGLFGPLTPMLKSIALVVTIVGAIPTAITAYHAWQYKVPFNQVSHRLEQYDILVRNLDCKIDYKALSTAQGTKVDVGACAKTGDISLKVSANDGKATYEWIAYNQLQKPGEEPTGSFLDLLIGVARAGNTDTPVRLAQGAMEVVCQSLVSKQQLVRVVKEGGKCFRETVSPVRGSVDKREEVPCETKCTAG
jgi:hypothetical protein